MNPLSHRLLATAAADTGELAISDSWGPQFRERWITEEAAATLLAGDARCIDF